MVESLGLGTMPLNSWFLLAATIESFSTLSYSPSYFLFLVEEPSCNIKVCRLSVSWECHEYLKCEFCRRVLFSWETLRVHVSSNHHGIASTQFPCYIHDSRMHYKFNIELYRCMGITEWMHARKEVLAVNLASLDQAQLWNATCGAGALINPVKSFYCCSGWCWLWSCSVVCQKPEPI